MGTLKLAVPLKTLRLPLRQALEAASRMGVKAIEWDARGEIKPRELTQTGLRQIRKLLEDLDLKVAAVGFESRRGYNVMEGLEQRVTATKEAMDLAHRLEAPWVVNHVGRVPPESKGRDWDLLVEILGDLGHYGQRSGATLAAETGSESGADLARLIASLPVGSLAAVLSPANLIVNGFSVLDAVAALGDHVQYVRANDAVRDLAQGRGVEVPVGRGVADYPSILAALEEWGYRGYLCVDRQHSEDPQRALASGVNFFRNL